MDLVGVMVLIQPAILCLIMGTTLLVSGFSWIFVIRHISGKRTKIGISLFVFLLSVFAFTLSIYLKFDLLPVYFEPVMPLPYSSAD